MAIEDNNKMFGEVFVGIPDGQTGWVSLTTFKLQRQRCGSHGWKTTVSKPSKDGRYDGSDIALGHEARDGRGWWRATALVTYKKRRRGPVLYREKVSSPRIGDCHPLPPPPA